MMSQLEKSGFQIKPRVFTDGQLEGLRLEVDRLAKEEGSACVRRICEKSAIFHELSNSTPMLELLPDGMRLVRAILFDKTPEANWPVAWHQDLTITVKEQKELPGYGPWSIKDGAVHVHPPVSLLNEMVTLRLHLDDATADNGALRVVPGSAARGKLSAELISEASPEEVVCECFAGDVLMMRPLILHASSRSSSASRRRVLHFEYAPSSALDHPLIWNEGNSLD